MLLQLTNRFSEDQNHVKPLLYLVPSILTSSESIDLQLILKYLQHWEADLPFPGSLGNELRRWNVLWNGKNQEFHSNHSDTPLPDNLLQALGSCDKDSFPNIHCILVIASTLPISSAEAERSFSLLRRVKTYLRSTMTEERLSDLAVIAMHYGERVSVDEVCKAFIQEHPRRLFDSSLFH